MCRLLGYSSTTATTFNEAVGDNFAEFVNLSKDHCDGWGIATTDNHKSDLYKEPLAANKSELLLAMFSIWYCCCFKLPFQLLDYSLTRIDDGNGFPEQLSNRFP